MSLTIELAPEVEARLRREAEARGVDPAEYAGQLIQLQLPTPEQVVGSRSAELSPDEWIRQFHEWAETHRNLPPLPPEAFERASFYDERW